MRGLKPRSDAFNFEPLEPNTISVPALTLLSNTADIVRTVVLCNTADIAETAVLRNSTQRRCGCLGDCGTKYKHLS